MKQKEKKRKEISLFFFEANIKAHTLLHSL